MTSSSMSEETVNLVPLTRPATEPSRVASTTAPSGNVTVNWPDSFVIEEVEKPSQSNLIIVSAPIIFPSSGLKIAEVFSS